MSKELSQLKKEIRADFALVWGSQTASNKRIEAMAAQLDQHTELMAEQSRRIEEQNRRVEASMKLVAGLAREVVASGDQVAGRLRQLDQRFITFLDALEKRQDQRYHELDKRLTRLERKGDPAA